ncbi:MAG: SPFH domain-containing protein [Polyangiaceae bacterium]|nr:SPFH domain-containing protein [Polyangiaceae bacterium]
MASVVTVQQGNVAVLTMFGKYSRILRPGLGFKIPFVEAVAQRISIQNRSADLSFQAITADQANVGFQAMLLYAVIDQEEQTIKNVAFKFIDYQSFMQALVRTVEGSVRSFVAKKRQAEILSLRREIIEEVKSQLDVSLETWGYHLIDLQMNDIRFDDVVMRSMAEVVASTNLRAAAENQGQALFITKTKQAEADAAAIRIGAEAERSASQLRGQGIALFREEVARGLSQAAKEIQLANLDSSFLLFSLWTEAVKHFGETGRGNVIFLDGSPDAMGRNLKELMAMGRVQALTDR